MNEPYPEGAASATEGGASVTEGGASSARWWARRYDAAAVFLALIYVGVLAATASNVGFTRDEGYYFKAADEYSQYFSLLFSRDFLTAFQDSMIQKHLGYNTEHPPLVKFVQGLCFHIFSKWTDWVSPSQGFRFAGFLFGGLSAWATYWLGREIFSRRVALGAAAMLVVMPRYFFDAHLACFDVPMTALWTLCLASFLAASRTGRTRHAMWAGVLFGLALLTKLNALFLPFLFLLHWAWSSRHDFGWEMPPTGGPQLRLPRIPKALLWVLGLGPALFVAGWPHLWHSTLPRIGAYLAFHLHHEHYPASYFHTLWVEPPFPWHFPVVMSALTVPVSILLLGTVGLFAVGRRVFEEKQGAAFGLLLASVLLPVFLIALPTSPIFGGVKHWYNALPGFCVLASVVFFASVDSARHWFDSTARSSPRLVNALIWLCFSLVVAPGVLGIAASHPAGIGFYNSLAGGIRGGAELGMQRGFWGGLSYPMFEVLESKGVRGAVFFNRTNSESFRMYRREGKLPPGVHFSSSAKRAKAAFHFEQPEHGEAEAEIWTYVATSPAAGVYKDNVTLSQLYVAPEASQPAKKPVKKTPVRLLSPKAFPTNKAGKP